ncbi:MAG: hypothetical protein ACMG6E_10690 [Candidatus Roizmanbacteria bacterium]
MDKNEGIYVKDKRTGEVKLIKGQEPVKGGKQEQQKNQLLEAHEELWEKHMSDVVERLISEGHDSMDYD